MCHGVGGAGECVEHFAREQTEAEGSCARRGRQPGIGALRLGQSWRAEWEPSGKAVATGPCFRKMAVAGDRKQQPEGRLCETRRQEQPSRAVATG